MSISQKIINDLFTKKSNLISKLNSLYQTEKNHQLIKKVIQIFSKELIDSPSDRKILYLATETMNLALHLHAQLKEESQAKDNHLDIIYGNLFIIDGVNFMNKIKKVAIKKKFYEQSQEIFNNELFFNINFFLKNTNDKIYTDFLLKTKKSWLSFPFELNLFLNKKKYNNREIKILNDFIEKICFLIKYQSDLFFFKKKNWFFERTTFMHFFLKKNHPQLFNDFKNKKKNQLPKKIENEIKKNLNIKLKKIILELNEIRFPQKESFLNFDKAKNFLLKQIENNIVLIFY